MPLFTSLRCPSVSVMFQLRVPQKHELCNTVNTSFESKNMLILCLLNVNKLLCPTQAPPPSRRGGDFTAFASLGPTRNTRKLHSF